MADIDGELARQEQIWAGLYGPPEAKRLIDLARERLQADPDADVRALLRSMEPSDDFDEDEAGTMRPI